MAISIIIGILILAVIVYTMIKIVKNIIIGLILIFFALIAGHLILGSIPTLRSIPIIGPLLPQTPSSFDIITYIKRIFQNVEISDVSRDAENNLLITVVNPGKLEVSNFTVFVDDNKVNIINKPRDLLKSGQTTVIQTDWDKDFTKILVQTSKLNATYSKSVEG
ncbi:MAG: hypothetical protein NTW30_02235 [Candidatus Aenigmarchaeota archaeon]|nr:hypothetical protein [Candidatus Aenigmarchaeota archaeon]